MAANHRQALEEVSREYDVPKDYEPINTELATRIIEPFCQGKEVLEIGCASGEMSQRLFSVCRSLTIVEPAASFAEQARNRFGQAVQVHGCFLHEIAEPRPFEVIVMASLLHHVEEPLELLADLRRFCGPQTRVLATVPHVHSLHRRLGVRAGLIQDVFDDTERNLRFRQFDKYDREKLAGLFVAAGFAVHECYGYMMKPFSSEQMVSLQLEPAIVDALFEMGKQYPELSSQLFLQASLENGGKGGRG